MALQLAARRATMAEVLGNVTSWLRWESQLALSDPWAATREFWTTFGPGGKLHPGAAIGHPGAFVSANT